jgi:hypothetical protein
MVAIRSALSLDASIYVGFAPNFDRSSDERHLPKKPFDKYMSCRTKTANG